MLRWHVLVCSQRPLPPTSAVASPSVRECWQSAGRSRRRRRPVLQHQGWTHRVACSTPWFRRRFGRPTCHHLTGFEGGATDRRMESGDRSNLWAVPSYLNLWAVPSVSPSPLLTPVRDCARNEYFGWLRRIFRKYVGYLYKSCCGVTPHTRAICVMRCVYVGKYAYNITSVVILCGLHVALFHFKIKVDDNLLETPWSFMRIDRAHTDNVL